MMPGCVWIRVFPGIIVSNHGARQLDHVGGTIEALPEVVEAVGGKIPVMIDGGFRRGTDIFEGAGSGCQGRGHCSPLFVWVGCVWPARSRAGHHAAAD